jgi:hypothetical protein
MAGLYSLGFFSSSSASRFSTASMSSLICRVRRVRFPLAVRWLMARIFFNTSSVIPYCLPKMFATRLLVCPVSKATRTSSQARRLSLERIRLSMAVSMIGVRSSLYCMFTLFWRACLRKTAPVLETVTPPALLFAGVPA